MKILNYTKFMALNPTLIKTINNQRGQIVSLYDDPIEGDLGEVIAVIEEFKEAVRTGFFDTSDFFNGSDYNPVYMHGSIQCAYNFDL